MVGRKTWGFNIALGTLDAERAERDNGLKFYGVSPVWRDTTPLLGCECPRGFRFLLLSEQLRYRPLPHGKEQIRKTLVRKPLPQPSERIQGPEGPCFYMQNA